MLLVSYAITLLVEFTYCISDINTIFLSSLDQFEFLFSTLKINRN